MSTDILAPLNYVKQVKESQTSSVTYTQLFASWFHLTSEQAQLANKFAKEFYYAVRIIDDVQDHTLQRNGKPTANAVYGDPLTINAGMIATVQLMKLLTEFNNAKVTEIFLDEFNRMWEGQGEQLQWSACPSLDEVIKMSEKKGVLATMFGRMLCALAGKDDTPYVNLFRKINLFLQVENDISGTAALRDITEGQYNFVTTYAIQKEKEHQGSNTLEQILKSRTTDEALLNKAKDKLIEVAAFEFSYAYKDNLLQDIISEIKAIGGNQFAEEMFTEFGSKKLLIWGGDQGSLIW